MDISDLPSWFLDIQRSKQNMAYGRIPLELVVSGNAITKVIGTQSHQTKFRTSDEARIFMLDHLNTKLREAVEAEDPAKRDGTITFSISHKGDKITQINTFDTVEYNYPL